MCTFPEKQAQQSIENISVIIPVYNRADVLEDCVSSVLAQSYCDIEIILIDDGSSDGSQQLCFKLSLQDKRIRAAHIRHAGASAARNTGLLISKGAYICFLDSDDCISKEMLEILYRDIQNFDADIASCRFRIEKGNEIFVPAPGKASVLTPHEAFEKMLINDGLCGYGVSPGTKLVKRSILTDPYPILFPEDVQFGEDTMWVTEVLSRASRVAMDKSVMMRYTYNCSNSICRNASISTRLRHAKWKLNYLCEHGYNGNVIDHIKAEEEFLINQLLISGI